MLHNISCRNFPHSLLRRLQYTLNLCQIISETYFYIFTSESPWIFHCSVTFATFDGNIVDKEGFVYTDNTVDADNTDDIIEKVGVVNTDQKSLTLNIE